MTGSDQIFGPGHGLSLPQTCGLSKSGQSESNRFMSVRTAGFSMFFGFLVQALMYVNCSPAHSTIRETALPACQIGACHG